MYVSHPHHRALSGTIGPSLSQQAPPMLFSLLWEARGIFQIMLFISGEQMFHSAWNHSKLIQNAQLITCLNYGIEKIFKHSTPYVEERPIYQARVEPTTNAFSLLSNSNQAHLFTWLMGRNMILGLMRTTSFLDSRLTNKFGRNAMLLESTMQGGGSGNLSWIVSSSSMCTVM